MSSIQNASATQADARCPTDQSLLIFPVIDEWFALPLASVRAVVTADLLHTLAGSQNSLAGWLELQGQEVLVLDMTQTLVPGAPAAKPQQIILLRAGDSMTGLITTGTSETVSMPTEQFEQLADTAAAPQWSLGLYRADGRTITVLDPRMFANSLCAVS